MSSLKRKVFIGGMYDELWSNDYKLRIAYRNQEEISAVYDGSWHCETPQSEDVERFVRSSAYFADMLEKHSPRLLREVCGGKRYNRETLEVTYKGKSISDVLNMTIDEACTFFENQPKILNKIRTLEEVGQRFDVTRERIRQIEAKALRKLRHPSRSKQVKDFLD